MSENEIMEFLPTEVLMIIFSFLTPKELSKCYQVCSRWKCIAESLLRDQGLWKKQCKKEFCDIYQTAYYKRIPGLNWCNIYKSLTLWPKLDQATETRAEFASATSSDDEIKNFQVLRNGIVGVHTQTSTMYYDIVTLKQSNRRNIPGTYMRYSENDDAIVIQGYHSHLYVFRKVKSNEHMETRKTFENVKLFLLVEKKVFYVSHTDEVFLCNLDIDDLSSELLNEDSIDNIISIGYNNGCLHLLSYGKEIYTLINKDLVWNYSLDCSSNLLNELKRFNFLENLNWRLYFPWLFVLRHTIQLVAPRSDITTINTYGEAVFVGSNLGVFRIYYAPYRNGEFDLSKNEPIKQYNFMDREKCPPWSACPIIKIDVIEGEDNHMVLVAMPKKIVILTYRH